MFQNLKNTVLLKLIFIFLTSVTTLNFQANPNQDLFIQAMRDVLGSGEPEHGQTWRFVDFRTPEYKAFLERSTNAEFLVNVYAMLKGPDGNLFQMEALRAMRVNDYRFWFPLVCTLDRLFRFITIPTYIPKEIATVYRSIEQSIEPLTSIFFRQWDEVPTDRVVTFSELKKFLAISKTSFTGTISERRMQPMETNANDRCFINLYLDLLSLIANRGQDGCYVIMITSLPTICTKGLSQAMVNIILQSHAALIDDRYNQLIKDIAKKTGSKAKEKGAPAAKRPRVGASKGEAGLV